MENVLSNIDQIVKSSVGSLKEVYGQYLILEDYLRSVDLETEFELDSSEFAEPEQDDEVIFVIPIYDNEKYLSFIYSKHEDKYDIVVDFVDDPSIFVHDLDDFDE